MARLNEAPIPQPADGVEALKRRFVRQNRDLARINTSQSMRIRSLELEQSQLQTENLCLREENLRLQHRLSESLEQPQIAELERVKTQLEQQLRSVIDVVEGLGRLQPAKEEQRRTTDPSSWRPPIPNFRLAGQELRMPSIFEGKSYPRKTLGAEEIRALRLSDCSNGSPDLGPPPVARFDSSDPIKFDPSKLDKERPLFNQDEESQRTHENAAVNLEARRKRRETTLLVSDDANERSDEHYADSTISDSCAASRGSSKRKLGAREEDDTGRPVASEPFTFTRKASTASNTNDQGSKISREDQLKSEPVVQIAERKVLGNKSTNMSPRKVTVGKKPLKEFSSQVQADAGKVRARRPKVAVIPPPSDADERIDAEAASTEPESNLPESLSIPDLFSPTPSEPSTIGNDQPHDAITTANLEGMRRPSRRARAVASYAEPSLHTKMRRSSVALVDAVSTNTGKNPNASRTPLDGAKVKAEPIDADESWRSMLAAAIEPSSPLRNKANLSSIRMPSPPAGRPASKIGEGLGSDGLAERMRSLSFNDNKPARRTSSASSRRHSSVTLEALSSSPASVSKVDLSSAVNEGRGAEAKPEIRRERASARRRSMMM